MDSVLLSSSYQTLKLTKKSQPDCLSPNANGEKSVYCFASKKVFSRIRPNVFGCLLAEQITFNLILEVNSFTKLTCSCSLNNSARYTQLSHINARYHVSCYF